MTTYSNAAPFSGPAVALVRNAKQLAALRKSLRYDSGHPNAPLWEDTKGTAGLTWTLELNDQPFYAVYIADNPDASATMGVIAHEALHVMRAQMRYIQEETPGEEHEAYTIQAVVAILVQQMADQLSKRRK